MNRILLSLLVTLFSVTSLFADETVLWEGEEAYEASWSNAFSQLAWGQYDWSAVKEGTILRINAKQTEGITGWCQFAPKNGSWADISGFTAWTHVSEAAANYDFELTQATIDALNTQNGLVIQCYGVTLYKISLVTPINYETEGREIAFSEYGFIQSSAFNGLSDDAKVEFTFMSKGGSGYIGWGATKIYSCSTDPSSTDATKVFQMSIKNEGENVKTYTLSDLKPLLDAGPDQYERYGLNWDIWNFSGDACVNTRVSVKAYEVVGYTGEGYKSPDTDDEPQGETVKQTVYTLRNVYISKGDEFVITSTKNEDQIGLAEKAKAEVTLTKFDGTEAATLPFVITTKGNISVTGLSAIPAGDYHCTIAGNVLTINGELYASPLQFILGIQDGSEAVAQAKEALDDEIRYLDYTKYYSVFGVNLFQYAPVYKGKIADFVDYALDLYKVLAEEEHVYNVIAELRKFARGIRPNLPETDKEYYIQHEPTGLYLSMSDDKVTLQKDPTPIQFHLTENTGGYYGSSMDPEHKYYQWHYTYNYAYIYSTAERKYLGYTEGEEYVEPTTQKNTVWYIECDSYNTWYIEIAYKYNDKGYNQDLYAPYDSNENTSITVDWDIYDGDTYSKEHAQNIKGWHWYIGEYTAPETAGQTTEEDNSTATSISSLSTAASASQIYNASGARVSTLHKGINIIRTADGKAVKVMK